MNDQAESLAEQVDKLEHSIRYHRQLYYNQQPEISDEEFDTLVEQLQELAPESEVLAEVGAPLIEGVGLPTKEHKIPMGSLDKVPEDRLDAWAEKTGPLFLVQEKLDGISLELEYEGGRLVDAITRGDGFVGEVITHNAIHFKNVLKSLPEQFTGSLRGEVILRLSKFKKHFETVGFANPRNTVSGTSRKKHGDRSLAKHFELFFFDVVGEGLQFETEAQKMEFMRKKLKVVVADGFEQVDLDRIKEIFLEYAGDPAEGIPGKRASLDYEIDGLVIRSDSIALQEELGVVSNRPRFAAAYKFVSEGRVTTLNDVDWSLGIGGRVTPVARLEPVKIAGVTVSNATLHNLDYLQDLDLKIGDRVLVERKGDVIPQVVKVIEELGGDPPEPPLYCPACDQKLEIDSKYLRCVNPDCPGKIYGDIKKWIDELEIDSIGEKWIEIFIDKNLIEDPADLYTLKVDDLIPLDRMGETLAQKMISNIAESANPSLDRFLAALNVQEFSRSRAQMLIDDGFRKLEDIQKAKVADLAAVKGFAEILAEKVVQGIEGRKDRIEKLLSVGVTIVDPPPPAEGDEEGGILEGKTFCFTGSVKAINPETEKRWTRKQLQDLVKANGGKALSGVSAGLNYLVMADPNSTSSKAKKARDLGTEILSEEAFLEMVL